MNIYLDTCALNRPTDDLSQPRIRSEAQALARIFDLIAAEKLHVIGSAVLQFEIQRNPDLQRRLAALKLLSFASATAPYSEQVAPLAFQLTGIGFTAMDALHLAIAQSANVHAFLTRMTASSSVLPDTQKLFSSRSQIP